MKSPRQLHSLLGDLIALPSVSPEGDSGGTKSGEATIAEYVGAFLRGLGAEVTLKPVQPGRPNVIATFAAKVAGAPTIALVPHLDTVGVSGMTIPPFDPMLRQGRMYGRGAGDTKGAMAAALWALHRWSEHSVATRSKVNWVFAATMGEEELSTGAAALCRAGFRADFAIALEPTRLKIVRAEKGVLRLWVDARGRAAHGATPERGDNAEYKLFPFLSACRDELAPAFVHNVHRELGGASLNPTSPIRTPEKRNSLQTKLGISKVCTTRLIRRGFVRR